MSKLQPLRELSGQPGSRVGTAIVPSRGKIRLQLLSHSLTIEQTLSFGLETKTVHLPLRHINAIELTNSRFWWLLWICAPNFLLFAGSEGENFFFGILFIATLVAFLVVQPRYLAIYSSRLTPILFFPARERASVERFAQTLLTVTRSDRPPAHRTAAPLRDRPH